MQIKLFYTEYNAKLSLGAMKYYSSATGRCLWSDLIHVQEAWHKSARSECIEGGGATEIAAHRLGACCEVISYDNAAYMFKALIDGAGNNASMNDIDDAMFNAGILPCERPDGMGEPWPIVLVQAAIQINKDMASDIKKKTNPHIKAD